MKTKYEERIVNPSEESFIQRLERLLLEHGSTKSDLARECKISKNGISTWKVTGAPPRADVACRIAGYLNVSVEYLITGKIPGLNEKKDCLAYKVAKLPVEKQKLVIAFIDAIEKQN